jgi:hypothetical protein
LRDSFLGCGFAGLGTCPKQLPSSYQHEARASELSQITRLRFVLDSGIYFERILNSQNSQASCLKGFTNF